MRGKPESKSKREAPEEQLWERIREERKETNRKPSTGIRKECMRDQAGKNEGNVRSESGRRALRKPLRGGDRKRRERKKQRLSSQNRAESGRKEAEGKRKIRKAEAGSKHLRNSCGSESGKGERKHTGKLST